MMHKTLKGLLLAAVLTFVMPHEPAQATSIAPLTHEQLTDASTYIVRGTVVDVWP